MPVGGIWFESTCYVVPSQPSRDSEEEKGTETTLIPGQKKRVSHCAAQVSVCFTSFTITLCRNKTGTSPVNVLWNRIRSCSSSEHPFIQSILAKWYFRGLNNNLIKLIKVNFFSMGVFGNNIYEIIANVLSHIDHYISVSDILTLKSPHRSVSTA